MTETRLSTMLTTIGWSTSMAAKRFGCSAIYMRKMISGELETPLKILDALDTLYKVNSRWKPPHWMKRNRHPAPRD